MTSGPPPTRYRVVERGRRLEVTDTWAGNRPPGGAVAPVPAHEARPVLAPAKLGRPMQTGTSLQSSSPPSAGTSGQGGANGHVWLWLIGVWVFISILFPLFWALPLILIDPRARKLIGAINRRGRSAD